ncbi:hypothetical protein CN074_00005 [Sinorhizobium medicae]|nr:hypothetical protein CN201_31720 [Sinorhizobium medicae]RVJ02093.1 hypothetical protein CN183_24145 [Sinorhizobium medicae]RVJ05507.1 hypothetical protein CN181_21005 [Sinorhizobium medicae]RVJ17611.1 hypothetical protein CN184_25605 [Sinorhizobium medicae]RVJ38530.1 hypothetical protein CN180_22365 [Sinorhizobium medicae]
MFLSLLMQAGGPLECSFRILIADTLREGVHLPCTEVKSRRRGGPQRRGSETKQRVISLRSFHCEEVKAKLCIHSPRDSLGKESATRKSLLSGGLSENCHFF